MASVDESDSIISCEFRSIGSVDSFICRLDLDGNLLWSKIFTDASYNFGYCIKGYDDFIYVCGNINAVSCLSKYDNYGNQIWIKTYEIPGTDMGEFIDFEIYDGYIYADGLTDSEDNSRQDLLVAKISLNGDLLWYKEWGDSGLELGARMVIGDNGFIYIAGYGTNDFIHINDYIWKYSLDGNLIWVTSTFLKSVLANVVYWNDDIYAIGEDRTFYRDSLLTKFDDQSKLIYYLNYKSDDPSSYAGGFTMDEYQDYFYLVGSNMGAGYIIKYDVTNNSDNNRPNTPSKPSGPQFGVAGKPYFYESVATDPDDDLISYCFSCGMGHNFMTYFGDSGQTMEGGFLWTIGGIYSLRVRVRDEYGFVSDWSQPLIVFILGPGNKMVPNTMFAKLLDGFPLLQKLIHQLGFVL